MAGFPEKACKPNPDLDGKEATQVPPPESKPEPKPEPKPNNKD